MRNLKYLILYGITGCVLILSCKKENIIGGSLHKEEVNMTTYDYLKTNPLFDTLVVLIDKADIKNEINGDNTFFAPTDYSIKTLLDERTVKLQGRLNDESLKYTLDSLPLPEMRDSLRSHLFKGKITRESVSLDNKLFTSLSNEPFSIKLIETGDYTDVTSTRPRYLYLVKIKNGLDPDPRPDGFPDENVDIQEACQTSNIRTTNGILHVLNNYHRAYW